MKLRKWLCPVLIVLCVTVYWLYGLLDDLRTDDEAPRISIGAEALQVSVSDPESAFLQGMTAEDNRDGDVTDSLIVESIKLLDKDGKIRVRYAAFDRSGNVTKAEREAQYTDYRSPRFALSGPLTVSQSYNFDLLKMISARDVLDGDISHRIRATNLDGYSISSVGTYEVLFSVTNSLGDTVQLQLPVEIRSSNYYNSSLTLTDYLVYLPVGAEFVAAEYLRELSVNGSTIPLTESLPEGYALKTEGTVDTQTPGVYVLDYEVVGGVYSGYSQLIVVVEE